VIVIEPSVERLAPVVVRPEPVGVLTWPAATATDTVSAVTPGRERATTAPVIVNVSDHE